MCHRFDILESFFLQPPCSTIILHNTSPSGLNLGGDGESNKTIAMWKLNPPCEGGGKRRVSQEATELPMGLDP